MGLNKCSKHEFSLYWSKLSESLSILYSGDSLMLDDFQLYRRISKVLRLKEGEILILFDFMNHASLELAAINKKTIELKLLEKKQNTIYKPPITFLLPLLKRDALQEAVYGLVELGINEIKLVYTQKVQRKWGSQKEFERLHNIMIAAAEQSKNYAGSKIFEPQEFQKEIEESQNDIFLFEPDGKSINDCIQSLRNYEKHIVLMIGPEGDLTLEEKKHLKTNEVTFCKLTPTVLRAQQAAIVGAGIFRSLLD
jgi:16S rRNA (uracil1498-N3)-methyltransferase